MSMGFQKPLEYRETSETSSKRDTMPYRRARKLRRLYEITRLGTGFIAHFVMAIVARAKLFGHAKPYLPAELRPLSLNYRLQANALIEVRIGPRSVPMIL
jgi:hypothetical protein